MKMVGLGGKDSFPMGYMIIRVQVDGVAGYNKEEIALVIEDSSRFGMGECQGSLQTGDPPSCCRGH